MLNKTIQMGRFTRDPELRSTPQGVSTCAFTLAVDRDYKEADGTRKTDFINYVAWRQTAEFISKYFRKGSMAVVEGSLQTRSWDKTEGGKGFATEVIVNNIYFGDSKKDTEEAPVITPETILSADDGDLPF